MVIFPDTQDRHTNELLRDSPTTNSLNWLSHTHSWCCKSFHDIEDDDNDIDSDLDASDLITNEFLNLRSYSIEFLTRCARPAEFWITTRAWVSQNFLQKTTFSKKSTFRWGAWPPPLLALSWAPTPSLHSSLKGDWSFCSGLSSLWLENGGFVTQYLHVKIYFTPKNPAVLSPDTWADSMGLWFERKTWIKMCQIFSKWLEKVEMGKSIQEDWKSDELRSSNLSVWVAASIAI